MADDDIFAERRLQLAEELRSQSIRDVRVLAAIAAVPRHLFVLDDLRAHAYENRALSIGEGQTISQPLVVAMMTQALKLKGEEKVLEIGTGSGYQAAILSSLAAEVHTVERSRPLYERVTTRLLSLGYSNVTCHFGDGTVGLPDHAPFDAIIVTAGSPGIPLPLKAQLRVGGRLVIPEGTRFQQSLQCVTKHSEGEERYETISQVIFVPLIGAHGWPDS